MPSLSAVDSVLMVADIARTLNDFRPPRETLERICERVTGLNGDDSTAVFMPDSTGQRLVLRGSCNLSPPYVRYINKDHPILLDDTRQLGLAPAAEAYRSCRPVILADIEVEPTFQPWRAGARLQGYRSIACIPIVVRSQPIGVLVCYGREPRQHSAEEIELLQLVARLAGVAIETARVAEGQRRAHDDLRALSEQLRRQNEELLRLNSMQFQLAETLADPDATALERTARTLAEITERSVLVASSTGHPIVYVGDPDRRDAAVSVAIRRETIRTLRSQRMGKVDGRSCVRIGTTDVPLGVIVLDPELENETGIAAIAASHAAAVMAAEMQSERADLALRTYARPAVLLGLAHGLYPAQRIQEVAGVLGIPADANLRLALFRTASSHNSHHISKRVDTLTDSGWPAAVATADGCDILVLLEQSAEHDLRRAGAELRRRVTEIRSIGVSLPFAGLSGASTARVQAVTAADVDLGDSAILYEELGVFGQLATDLPPQRVEGWIEDVLGRLRAYDSDQGACLVDTLAVYVRHQGQVKLAAAELGVHPNTILQRMRRCADVSGLNFRDFRDLGRVVLALELQRLLPAGRSGGTNHERSDRKSRVTERGITRT